MKIGDKLKWNSKTMVGNDGAINNVFTINATGRNWRSRQYFVRKDNSATPYDVIALTTTTKRTKIPVIIASGGSKPMYEYAKKPYMRKDGTSNPNIRIDYLSDRGIKGAYGVIEYEKGIYWPKDDLIAWYGQTAYDIMEAYGNKVVLAKVDL